MEVPDDSGSEVSDKPESDSLLDELLGITIEESLSDET